MFLHRFFICEVGMSGSAALRQLKKDVRQAAFDAALNASTDLQSSGRDVVRTWKNKPDFGETIYNSLSRIEVVVKPKGKKKAIKIFQYVDKGTKGPYLIFPKPPNTYLSFKGGYSAKTAPIAKYNVGSGQSFGKFVRSKGVVHPGIKARDFLEWFLEDLTPSFRDRVQREINQVV